MSKELSRSKAGMGGGNKSSSKKHHPHETHIRHIKSGGHVVTHHFKGDDGEAMEPEEHIMGDKQALLAHLAQAVPDNGPAQAAPAPEAPPAGPSPTAAPGPMAPPQGM